MRKTFLLLCMGATLAVAAQDKIDRSEKGRLISITEGGVLAGNSDNVNSTPFSFHTSLNWALTGRLSAGLGAGVEFLKETHLPVTLNYKATDDYRLHVEYNRLSLALGLIF